MDDATPPRVALPLLRGGLNEDGPWLAKCDACPFAKDGLPSKPVLSEHPEDPAWLIIGEGPGHNEVRFNKPFCLTPDTPVLMADLTWKPIGEIVEGDKIVAPDEESGKGWGASGRRARRWHVATVTRTHRRVAEVLEVRTTRGVLRGSADHPVLVRRGGNHQGSSGATRWLELGKLQTNAHHGPTARTSRIVFVAEPWAQRTEYDAAWMAGFLDGEGHVSGSKRFAHHRGGDTKRRSDGSVGFTQNAGPTWDRAVSAVERLGYTIGYKSQQRSKGVVCNSANIRGGLLASMRFLGEIRPERLVADFQIAVEDKHVRGLSEARVLSREPIGEGELVDITTTTGTFIANGFVAHNCGASGQVVNKALAKIGRVRDTLYIGNATLCIPFQGATEQDRQRAAECCKPRLLDELAQFPGKPILTLGAVAARTVIPQEILDAIDPPDTPKAIKKAQKLRSSPELKSRAARRKAVAKESQRRLKKMIEHHRKRLIVEAKVKYRKRPDERYLQSEVARVQAKLQLKAQEDAIKAVDLKLKERAARALVKAQQKTTKPKKKKPIKITDIVGTLFDVDVDGSGVRPVIPAIHPAALLRGGGASIGGSHTPDMAFVNIVFDAMKIDSLAKGRNIRLDLNLQIETANFERAVELFLAVYRDAIDEGAVSIDLETYVEDENRHHALMAYVARTKEIGLATKRMAVSLAWDLLPDWCRSMLQLLLGSVETTYHNGLYDRTVLRNKHHGFVIPEADPWFDCYIDTETEFLTEVGWKHYDDVSAGDRLGTINANGALEWHPYFDRVDKLYEGRALVFETTHTRAVVTGNHRMWCRPLRRTRHKWRGTPMGPWKFERADDMLSASTDSFDVLQTCAASGGEDPDPAFLQLLGLWLADGAIRFHKGVPYRASISQIRGGRASRLLRRLAKHFSMTMCEATHNERWRTKPTIEEIWVLHDPRLAAKLATYGARSRSRRLPQEALAWSRRSKEIFLEALFLGDGSEAGGRGRRFIYRSGSEALADGVQALALSIGWTATNPRTYRPDGICHVFINRDAPRSVQIRARTKGPNASIREIRVRDRMVCFSVPNETLITRSRGKPAFYGNTLLAHHAAFPGNSHRLQVVTSQFYGVGPWKSEYRNQEETPETLALYNAKDTGGTHALRAPLQLWLKKTKTERVFDLDRKMSDIASRMHLKGMPVDREINSELLKTFSKSVKESRQSVEETARDPKLREQIWHHLAIAQARKQRKLDPSDFEERYQIRLSAMKLDPDWKWKIGAGKHISALLLSMGIALTEVTEGGDVSTKKDVLESLVEHQIVREILTFRENDKLHSTFVAPIFDRFDELGNITQYGYADEFSRIHPIWNVHRITGRWASQWPVVSNVPKDKWKKLIGDALAIIFGVTLPEKGALTLPDGTIVRVNKDGSVSKMVRPNLRRQVRARPGRILVGFDFAQIEARVIALISGDPFLCAIFAENRDPHIECSRIIWPHFDGLDPDTRKQLRENVKNIEYGFMYMAQLDTLHQTMLKAGNLIAKKDLAMAIGKLATAMAGIIKWQRDSIVRASVPPYEISDFVLGRRRVWPMGQVEGPEAVNYGVQTAAASIMNTGMALMMPRLEKYQEAFPIAQIHDAAVFECWADDAERLAGDVREAYTQAYERDGRSIPFPVDVKIGQDWASV